MFYSLVSLTIPHIKTIVLSVIFWSAIITGIISLKTGKTKKENDNYINNITNPKKNEITQKDISSYKQFNNDIDF